MAEHTGAGTISVVVPVYNGAKTIGAAIEHLLNQSLPPQEIIVVDDGSTDETAEILRSFGNLIIALSKPNGGPASARNTGIRASSSSLIAFTDSDCRPEIEWLEELVKGFHAPKIAGVGGAVRRAEPGLIGEHTDFKGDLNPAFAPGGKVLCLVTANACFRRAALVDANLFDERFRRPGGEDTELSVRLSSLGYEFAYVGTAIVLHHHRTSILRCLSTAANYGEGWYLLGSLWPGQQWESRSFRKMVRSAIAVRSMLRFYRTYRKQFDAKTSMFFSILDHYQYVAQSWGYLRGKRRLSIDSLVPLPPQTGDAPNAGDATSELARFMAGVVFPRDETDLSKTSSSRA